MRTATPLVTCSSMVDCRERATAGDISTPPFMGPGGMTKRAGGRSGSSAGAPLADARSGVMPQGRRVGGAQTTTSAPRLVSPQMLERATRLGAVSPKIHTRLPPEAARAQRLEGAQCIVERFALLDAGAAGGDVDDVGAQRLRRQLERGAGAGARLVEQGDDGLAAEGGDGGHLGDQDLP